MEFDGDWRMATLILTRSQKTAIIAGDADDVWQVVLK